MITRFEFIVRTAISVVVQMLLPWGWFSQRIFIQKAYQRFLVREANETELGQYLAQLQAGELNRLKFIAALINADEFDFRMRSALNEPIVAMALHQARCTLVQQLPGAQDILDLGGANADNLEGSLLSMGYMHPAKHITIVDLPPEDRFAQMDSYANELNNEWITTERGPAVRYLHRSMADLEDIPNESMDFIWSGETIEHVSYEDAQIVLKESFRILRPGGYFCLDTPNAILARIQSPNEFIFPEHQYEYQVDELAQMVEQAGFCIEKKLGIGAMPNAIATNTFNKFELYQNSNINDDPHQSYLFYFKCSKPA